MTGRYLHLEGVTSIEQLVLIAHGLREAGFDVPNFTFDLDCPTYEAELKAEAIAERHGASWAT
jgi:hypothetical protein